MVEKMSSQNVQPTQNGIDAKLRTIALLFYLHLYCASAFKLEAVFHMYTLPLDHCPFDSLWFIVIGMKFAVPNFLFNTSMLNVRGLNVCLLIQCHTNTSLY